MLKTISEVKDSSEVKDGSEVKDLLKYLNI